jgi:predicted anti-sigma-YlaC factor YlaD
MGQRVTSGTGELTCRDLAAFLAEYVGGTLDPQDRELFEAHLAECPDCVTYLRGYAETIRLLRETRDGAADPAPGVPEELVEAILAARRRGRTR